MKLIPLFLINLQFLLAIRLELHYHNEQFTELFSSQQPMIKTIIITIWIAQAVVAADQLDLFVGQMTNLIDNLANQTLGFFSKFNDKCLIKSYHECEGTSQLACFQDFPALQGCAGQGVNFAVKDAIKLPESSVKQNLTKEQKHVICKTAELQPYFESFHANRNGRFFASYIGSSTGMFRIYPTIRQDQSEQNIGNCKNYDPRFRGWYTSSITGKKQIVMLVDNSNSMKSQLSTVKVTMEKIVQSLTTDDNMIIYTLGSDVQEFTEGNMVMNEQSKEKIKEKIQNITNEGLTNLVEGFERAFKALDKEKKMDNLCCKDSGINHIIFLVFTNSITEKQETEVTETIQSYNDTFKVQIFPYSFVTNNLEGDQKMENLACNHNGEYFQILGNSSEADIKSTVQQVYAILGNSQNFDKPRWSEFYIDAFGFGQMSTISKPIYYKSKKVSYLVGVAGIDVPVTQWEKLDSLDEVKRRLKNPNQYKIGQYTCRRQGEKSSLPPFQEIKGQIFVEPVTTETSKCCNITTGALIGIIVGSVVLIGIIVGIIVYCYCCKKKNKEQVKKSDEEVQKQMGERIEKRIAEKIGSDRALAYSYPQVYMEAYGSGYKSSFNGGFVSAYTPPTSDLKFPVPPSHVIN